MVHIIVWCALASLHYASMASVAEVNVEQSTAMPTITTTTMLASADVTSTTAASEGGFIEGVFSFS